MRILKPELLVPVGSQEALYAAVQSGADAIYLGGKKFNARGNANNFNNEQLLEAIKYAHLYGVRVYITFNTLIKEKELAKARDFAEFLCCSHCDAVIVQDLGVASMIKRYFPQLELHASTQMTIHNLDGVKILEDMGFKRVVLARELSMEEISYIAQRTSLELETFIHGALCVCYSGQCLMSSVLGGRSGNRGLCAQPCRLPYRLEGPELKNDKNKLAKYLLSPRDLAAYSFLPKLVQAGVKSFKIEGRMKRPEYIAIVTQIYRKLIDNIYEGILPGYSPEDEEELLQIFNRGGFCSGYYYGFNSKELMNPDKPGHWGIYLGKVLNIRGRWIDIELESGLEIGDGIEFRNNSKVKAWGQEVKKIQGSNGIELDSATSGSVVSVRKESKQEVIRGATVWRISQKSQLEKAANQFNERYIKKIAVYVHGVFRKGRFPLLEFQDFNGLKGIAIGEQNVQVARKAPLSRQTIEKQISRLGDTPFQIYDMDIEVDEDIFMPLSVINELRRKACLDLIEKRIASMGKTNAIVKSDVESYFPFTIDNNIKKREKAELYVYTEKMIEDDEILKAIDGLGLIPKNWNLNFTMLKDYIYSLKEKGLKTRLILPRIMRHEDINVMEQMDAGIWNLFDAYQAGNLGAIYFLKSKGVRTIIGDYSLNIFNSIGVEQLANLGIKGVVLSPELQYREIQDITAKAVIPCEIMIFGYIPLMIMEYCPVGEMNRKCSRCELERGYRLVDRKGLSFPLKRRKVARCYTEILNSQLLMVADEMERISEIGVQGYGLNLEGYGIEDMKEIINLHRFAIDYPGQSFPHDLENVLNKLKNAGYTRGHFFRGVE